MHDNTLKMNTPDEILAQLNEPQQDAVKTIQGPLMVIAGAGSGKTRVLTYRIAYMLQQGINPFSILALTFTNKAASEMKNRIREIVGEPSAKSVTMGTFHSVFYKILRVEAEKLGFGKNLVIYDTDDAKNVLKTIIKELNLDPKVYTANHVLNRISSAKSALISAVEYENNPETQSVDSQSGKPYIAEIFKRYNARLRNANAMDFDDLLYYMNVLLRDFPEMLHKYQNRYQYILVDEYQDTNFAQYLIVKKLSSAHQNICIVGDDAQSIYSFRGANIQNILNFKRDYPSVKVVKLEQNYRSTQNIVNAANAVIKNNKDQISKEVWTDNPLGSKIELLKANSDADEAHLIANAIFENKQNYHIDNKCFAILYRTNAQSRSIEEALIRRNIPYAIFGGLSFYKRKEIKDVMAYFRLTINHYDEESLRRIINYPMRGIGATTLDKVLVCAKNFNTNVWNVVQNPELYNLDVNTPTKTKLKEFATLISSFSSLLTKQDAYQLGKYIVSTVGILKDLANDPSDADRVQNVEELLDAMKEFTDKDPETSFNDETGEIIENYFPSLDHFLETVSLLTDDESEDKENQDKVKLMTIHAAKGLEFDYVFVTGMEENLFPSALSVNSRAELEEERRLFYVAMTRARKVLYLSFAQTRYRYGSQQFCEPSRFLGEIPPHFLNIPQKASSKPGVFGNLVNGRNENSKPSPSPNVIKRRISNAKVLEERKIQTVGAPATPEQIIPGIRVYHDKFGFGQVLSTDGVGVEKKATVAFVTVGTKTLLLKFAKLIIPN